MVNDKLVGMRLKFADLIAVQHFTRKVPEHADGHDDPGPELLAARLSTLFIAARRTTSASIDFAGAAINAYLDKLDSEVVRTEPLER